MTEPKMGLFRIFFRRKSAAHQQAQRWWSVLRDDENIARNLAAFSEWLEADSTHARAFEKICRAHGQTLHPPRPLSRPGSFLQRRGFVSVFAAMALLLILDGPPPDIRVPASSWQVETLDDGSTVQFGPSTSARLQLTHDKRLITLDRGSVIIEAAKDVNRPMEVKTTHGTVRVVGTRFVVIVDATGTEVSVSRGKVEVITNGRPTEPVALLPSQRVRIAASQTSTVLSAIADPEEVRHGWRTWVAAPLADLTTALANESGRKIVTLPTASKRSGPITGRFFVQDGEATLALLTEAYGLRRFDAPLGVTVLY